MPLKLTTHLPTTTPPTKATTHPFLSTAGKGLLPRNTLAQWLSQDRLYAQSYIRFIGLLLSKLQLSPAVSASFTATSTDQKSEDLTTRTITILIDALNNIHRELKFFETTAQQYGLDLNTPTGSEEKFAATPITHAYIDMFMAAGSPAASILEGLVVLWATEVCYLRAWRYAASFLDQGVPEGGDMDGGALRKEFIPNWASGEFEEFVNTIGEVVDDMGVELGVGEKREVLERCEGWWRQVVWLEERFWPDV